MALSDLEIKRTKTKDKHYKLSDGGNMYLSVTPAGGKLWRWAFRYEGKAKLMTFGRYPDVVDLGHDADRLGDGGGNLAVVSDVFGGESAPPYDPSVTSRILSARRFNPRPRLVPLLPALPFSTKASKLLKVTTKASSNGVPLQ
jgi:hypothetical protein